MYHVIQAPKAPTAVVSADEAKLVARSDEKRARAAAAAQKLRQQDLGQGYQFDAQGNLLAATADGTDLPQNRVMQEGLGAPRPSPASVAIGRGIDRATDSKEGAYADDLDVDDDAGYRHGRGAGDSRGGDDNGPTAAADDRAVLTASMLGYSTVAGASWASRRPAAAGDEGTSRKKGEGAAQAKEGHQGDAMERVVTAMEDTTRTLVQQASAPKAKDEPASSGPGVAHAAGGMGTAGYWGPGGGAAVAPGPSVRGEALYAEEKPGPAERAPQSFVSGAVGDMRIGGSVGPDQVVRQGKFLDCAIINEIRSDLVDSPVMAMVSRDFVSIDGKYVLIPAGSKLLGEAGRTQNIQQARVYIKFDRIIFPDQRSAFFPTRKVPGVDAVGAVGVEGDVDRHLFMQFGAAVMLGVLDGIGAAVQGPGAGTSPTLRELVMARTSSDFSSVIAGVIQKYANVVPTVTIDAGSKMKVFFSDDVRLSPYMRTMDLSWMTEP
jgi:type IV secretory pathway VirB10-like protein